jgi:hypothetical protein
MHISTSAENKYNFLYGLDLRSISAFRIALSFSLLLDFFIYRLPAVTLLYSNAGMMSSKTAAAYPDASSFSLLYYISEPPIVILFFGIYFLLLILLLVGFKTKITSVVCFVFLYSIQQRVAPFLYGGDDVLRVALFWAMFLPLGDRFGVKNSNKVALNNYKGFAAFAILLQISLIYFFNAALKSGETWSDGTAVAYAASIFEHQAKFSHIIIENETLSSVLTFATKAFEYCVPLLIFSPFYNNKTRFVASLIIILFHFGLIPFLDVNTFYLSTLPFAVILLPSGFWQLFEKQKNA